MRYARKDISDVQSPGLIAHGVNCQDRMGAGVAKALFTKWPLVKSAYHAFGYVDLGNVQFITVEPGLIVANCFTQQHYGRKPGVQYADPEAVSECLVRVAEHACIELNVNEVFIPRIGCGLGGLDWETDVVPVIQDIEEHWPVSFVICDL